MLLLQQLLLMVVELKLVALRLLRFSMTFLEVGMSVLGEGLLPVGLMVCVWLTVRLLLVAMSVVRWELGLPLGLWLAVLKIGISAVLVLAR